MKICVQQILGICMCALGQHATTKVSQMTLMWAWQGKVQKQTYNLISMNHNSGS